MWVWNTNYSEGVKLTKIHIFTISVKKRSLAYLQIHLAKFVFIKKLIFREVNTFVNESFTEIVQLTEELNVWAVKYPITGTYFQHCLYVCVK